MVTRGQDEVATLPVRSGRADQGRPEAPDTGAIEGTEALRSQFSRFAFFKARPSWQALPAEGRRRAGQEFLRFLTPERRRLILASYSLVGLRADVDFMLWLASEELGDFTDCATALARTELARHLDQPHSFLAVTKRSVYVKNQRDSRPTGHRLHLTPAGRQYLFVYPFVKTRAWYALPVEERQAMMNEHIRAGNRFPSVRLNTTYSFGLDDQEFVVAFETDEPRDFVELVMALRESRASAYTLRDTPMFTCKKATPEQILESLGV